MENPCDGISLGSCFVEAESILKTSSACPDRCSKLCEMKTNCEFWRALWAAPSFVDQCTVNCPDGWTLARSSCYFLSTEIISPFTEAVHSVQFCHSLDSTLVEVNTEVENAIVVALAEEALAIDNNIVCDFWMGGVRTEDGTWRWQSGDPMDCTNWCEHCPDTGKKGQDCSQLLQNGNPGTLDTFYCARETINGSGNGSRSENGVICEKNLDK